MSKTELIIKKHLTKIMTEGDVSAGWVLRGYNVGTGKTGWHFVPFGQQAIYLGKNAKEARETIDDMVAKIEEVQ